MVEATGGDKKPVTIKPVTIKPVTKKPDTKKPDTKKNYCVSGSSIGFEGGNYRSNTPSAAAKKAVRIMFSKIKDDKAYVKHKNVKQITFILRLKSKTKKDIKYYAYTGTQKKLTTPKKIKIAGKEIVYKFEYILKPKTMPANEVKKMTGGFLDEAIDIPEDAVEDAVEESQDVIDVEDIDNDAIDAEDDVEDTVEDTLDTEDVSDVVEEVSDDDMSGGGKKKKKPAKAKKPSVKPAAKAKKPAAKKK